MSEIKCSACGSANVAYVLGDNWQCHDCGEDFIFSNRPDLLKLIDPNALNDVEMAAVNEAIEWLDPPDGIDCDDDRMVIGLLEIIGRLSKNLPIPPDEMDDEDDDEWGD